MTSGPDRDIVNHPRYSVRVIILNSGGLHLFFQKLRGYQLTSGQYQVIINRPRYSARVIILNSGGLHIFFSKIEGIPVDKSAISRHWQPCPHYHFEFRNYKNLITRWKMNNTLSINDKMGCLSNLKFSEFNPILSKKTKIVSIFLFWKEITIKCIRKIFFFGQNWTKIEWLGFKDVNIYSREFLGCHVNIPG